MMNLFDNKDKVMELNNNISVYAKANGLHLLCKGQKWVLFQRDELKVQIEFVERNKKKQLEFMTPLFYGISDSLEIFIRPICGEKNIRDIAKGDLIDLCGDRLNLIKYVNINDNLFNGNNIKANINSMVKRAKILQDEISGLLDYTMFIKLN